MNINQSNQNDKPEPNSGVSLNIAGQGDGLLSRLQHLIKNQTKPMVAIFALVLLAIMVIFFLPKQVQPLEEVSAEKFVRQELSKPIEESPWQEAQLAKYRKEAQEILAQVVDKKTRLENKQVNQWAMSEFSLAMESATQGDVEYRTQAFEKAITSYQQALRGLTAIEGQLESKFAQFLSKGLTAIDNKDSQLAKQQLRIAAAIEPNNERVINALSRADVLSDVINLVNDGKNAMSARKFKQAEQLFIQASQLDPDSVWVKTHLTKAQESITSSNFSRAMSKGYQLLADKQYQQAIGQFQQAKQIEPQDPSVDEAIKQAKNQQKSAQIAQKMQQAKQLEDEELWSKANSLYEQVLELDNSVVDARIGEIQAKQRAKLDTTLVNILKLPQRLTENNVYRQAQYIVGQADKLAKKGPRLNNQLAQIKTLFTQLQIPVDLVIESDNQTQIKVVRGETLGNFATKKLTLKPGQYILLGSREGYRDVRKEVMLMPNSQNTKIEIACREKVKNG